MKYKVNKIFAFLVIVLISIMFLTSVSFGENNKAHRVDSGSSIKEGNRGIIYNLNDFIEKEDRGGSPGSKSMNLN